MFVLKQFQLHNLICLQVNALHVVSNSVILIRQKCRVSFALEVTLLGVKPPVLMLIVQAC